MRVASDGDNSSDEGAGSAGAEQSVEDSSGSAQAGSPEADAPVRVLSDGDNSSAGEGGLAAGTQSADGSSGTAQVGSPRLFAPIRVLTGGSTPGEAPEVPDVERRGRRPRRRAARQPVRRRGRRGEHPVDARADAGDAPEAGGSPSAGELRRLLDGADPDPQLRFASGGVGDATDAAGIQTVGLSGDNLPLTGFGFAALAALGLWLLSSGLALRLVPGGKRR